MKANQTGGRSLTRQDILIRPIKKDEIGAVQDFLLRQLKEHLTPELQASINKDVWQLEITYLDPENSGMWGAFTSEGELVGTAAVCPYNDRMVPLKGRYHGRNTAEVGRCYIDKHLRRQGIGRRLFQIITAFCQEHGYHMMYLHTHRFFPGGFNFWRNQGFTITVDEEGAAQIVHMERIV
jgi:GNAT superfamily N-acetyltransferase